MKYLFIFILYLFITSSISAQVDSNKETSTNIPAIEGDKENIDPITPIKIPSLTNPNTNKVNGLSVPEQKEIVTQKREFSMFNEKFGNPGELYEKKIKKHFKYTENANEAINNGSTTNQYLGDFKTKVSKVNVIYRDHQYPDGDLIRVFVNDDVVQPQVLLKSSFNGFKLDLVKGFNKIDFLALNQGESGPNTAEFQILDEQGNVISSNTWNLATGIKATIILIKE